MGKWSHQNAYRRKRYLEQTLQRTLRAEQLRTVQDVRVLDGTPYVTAVKRCTAQSGSTGRRCTLPPVSGSDVCRFHGGLAPNTRKLAAVRHVLLKAKAAIDGDIVFQDPWTGANVKLDEKLRTATKKDPREVLLQQVHEAAAMAAATREMAGDIDVEDLQDPESEGHLKAKQTHELFLIWNERAVKSSKMALDVGIDEAMVKLAELQAKAIVRALKSVLTADVLGLSPAQQKLAQALLGQELRNMVPDISESPTYMLNVGGESIPYNPAMDAYVDLDRPMKDRGTEYRDSRKVHQRDVDRERRAQREQRQKEAEEAAT